MSTIYIALLPKGACGSAGWVSNTTHYDCFHYRRMQERNPFSQPARRSGSRHAVVLIRTCKPTYVVKISSKELFKHFLCARVKLRTKNFYDYFGWIGTFSIHKLPGLAFAMAKTLIMKAPLLILGCFQGSVLAHCLSPTKQQWCCHYIMPVVMYKLLVLFSGSCDLNWG